MTYPRSHGELVSCLQRTIGLEIRGDLCHNRKLASLAQRRGRGAGWARAGLESGAGGLYRGWRAGVEDMLLLLKIYIDSSSSLGENNPNGCFALNPGIGSSSVR